MKSILSIMKATKKKQLRAVCKTTSITEEEFADFIMYCEAGVGPWRHRISYRQFIPDHLKDVKVSDLSKAKVGEPAPPEAKKAMMQISQIFEQRRYLVGHLFFTPDLNNWHLFYFDQRDTARRDNHWVEGAHIHLLNWLWPNLSCKAAWDYFNSGNVQMQKAIHIRFERPDR